MAVSETIGIIGPFLSWTFLPSILTQICLKFLYEWKVLSRPANRDQAQIHTQRVRALVIASYLIYTIYASLFPREPNFYQILGVPLDVEVEDVRRAFRKLARIYHPDKVGGGEKSEHYFILLRVAHDCLVDLAKRSAYDRFGPAVITWTDSITEREFFNRGLKDCLTFYIVQPIIFGFFEWVNGDQVISFWKFSLLAFMFALESNMVMNPKVPKIVNILFPMRTAHDLISSLHQTYIAINLASKHVDALLPELDGVMGKMRHRSFGTDRKENEADMRGLVNALNTLETLSGALREESATNMAQVLRPYRPSDVSTADTVQQAAQAVAAGRSHPRMRVPSKMEGTFLHLFSQRIYRARLEALTSRLGTETDSKASVMKEKGDSPKEKPSPSTEEKAGEGENKGNSDKGISSALQSRKPLERKSSNAQITSEPHKAAVDITEAQPSSSL